MIDIEVERWGAAGHRRLVVERSGDGWRDQWLVDGEPRPDLDGAEAGLLLLLHVVLAEGRELGRVEVEALVVEAVHDLGAVAAVADDLQTAVLVRFGDERRYL